MIGVDLPAEDQTAPSSLGPSLRVWRRRPSTLIEAEVLDSLTLPERRTLGYPEARRNIGPRWHHSDRAPEPHVLGT